jgi:exopolyphosphatase/guanosine-5'-triphosphate,3'-diphosphate pyrophosphatase
MVEALGAATVDVVGTAAVREAKDGPDFARLVKQRAGFDVRTITGHEEARLSALGAASAAPGLTGVVGDLGGASLELVAITDGVPGQSSTLGIGPLRFKDSDFKAEQFAAAVDRELAGAPWLGTVRGQPIHVVGGTWRALARLHMAERDYPLPIIHGHRLTRVEAEALCRLVAGLSAKTMRRVASVPRRRQETLPYGAVVLGRVLARLMPSEVVFSAYGLREGLLYERLSPSERKIDPLLAGCAEMSARLGRGTRYGEALDRWLAEAFPATDPREATLRRAASDLSEVAWRDHPDYRAEHAFHQVLRAPFVGLSHAERAFLAMTVSSRYRSGTELESQPVVKALLTPQRARQALALGHGLRLAALLSAGHAELLQTARLNRVGVDTLRLSLADAQEPAMLRRLERLIDELGEALGVKKSGVRDAALGAVVGSG